jgi:hypothetical protein
MGLPQTNAPFLFISMDFQKGIKFQSFVEFWEYISENERIIVDILRHIVLENIPQCKEKLTYNVPYFYGNRRICLIWPGSIPWGGFREGVFFGFCYGHLLTDPENYLHSGTNKQVFYRIFHSPEEIDEQAITNLLHEAVEIDKQFKPSGKIKSR